MDKLSLLHFNVSSELSEVRKHIGSIYQFLLEPQIQNELFLKAIQKIGEKREEEDLMIVTGDSEKRKDQTEVDKLNALLLVSEPFRLQFLAQFRPVINGLLSMLNDMLSSHPIKINMLHIAIVEVWYWFSNVNPKLSSPQIKLIDGRVKIIEAVPDPFDSFFDKRFGLIKTDLGRRFHTFQNIGKSFLTDREGAEEQARDLLNGNLVCTDPLFGMYFAFTLSQCSVYDIKGFLNYQKSEFTGDFNEFLEVTLLKYSQLLTEEQTIIVSNWMNKKEVKQNNPEDDKTAIDYKPILGNLGTNELVKFFSFLHLETNGEATPFLSPNDVNALLKNDFSLSSEPNPKFKLALDGSKSAGIIYYCIHCLYMKHGKSRNDKKFIARFFYENFTDFSKISFKNFMNAINPTKPKTMLFDLVERGYLKD